MKISHKLHLLLAINIALLVAIVGYGLAKMNSIGTYLGEIAHEDIPLVEALTRVTVGQLDQAMLMEKALRVGGVSHGSVVELKEIHHHFSALAKSVDAAILAGEKIAEEGMVKAHSAEAKQEFSNVLEQLKLIEKQHAEYDHHVEKILTLVEQGDLAAAGKLVSSAEHEQKLLAKELESLLLEVEHFTEAAVLEVEELEQAGMIGMVGIAVAAFLLGLIFNLWLNRGITGSLSKVTASMREITNNKDLTLRLDEGEDELGQMAMHFNGMMGSISEVVEEVSAAANQLAAASEELSAITTQSNAAVQSQREEMGQSATAMTQMTASMHEVAKSASSVSESVNHADKEALVSRAELGQATDSINVLAGDVMRASDVIQKLAQDSQDIGKVLEVIQDIAEQTNLLALNAAIEAARAGEQGRGFAVVADEVRTLAQRTRESTDEVQQTIDRLQASARDAVTVMDEGKAQADSSVAYTEKTNGSIVSIIESVGMISDMAAQIASAAEEQSAVSEEINRSIVSMNSVSEEVSVGADQTAQASHDIAQLATKLSGMVRQFKV